MPPGGLAQPCCYGCLVPRAREHQKSPPDILVTLEKPLIDSLFSKIDADPAKLAVQVSHKAAQ